MTGERPDADQRQTLISSRITLLAMASERETASAAPLLLLAEESRLAYHDREIFGAGQLEEGVNWTGASRKPRSKPGARGLPIALDGDD
jgi:hypothetical protein